MMMKSLRCILDRVADNIKCWAGEKHQFVKHPQMPEETPQGSSQTLPHFNTETIQALSVFLSSFC